VVGLDEVFFFRCCCPIYACSKLDIIRRFFDVLFKFTPCRTNDLLHTNNRTYPMQTKRLTPCRRLTACRTNDLPHADKRTCAHAERTTYSMPTKRLTPCRQTDLPHGHERTYHMDTNGLTPRRRTDLPMPMKATMTRSYGSLSMSHRYGCTSGRRYWPSVCSASIDGSANVTPTPRTKPTRSTMPMCMRCGSRLPTRCGE